MTPQDYIIGGGATADVNAGEIANSGSGNTGQQDAHQNHLSYINVFTLYPSADRSCDGVRLRLLIETNASEDSWYAQWKFEWVDQLGFHTWSRSQQGGRVDLTVADEIIIPDWEWTDTPGSYVKGYCSSSGYSSVGCAVQVIGLE